MLEGVGHRFSKYFSGGCKSCIKLLMQNGIEKYCLECVGHVQGVCRAYAGRVQCTCRACVGNVQRIAIQAALYGSKG